MCTVYTCGYYILYYICIYSYIIIWVYKKYYLYRRLQAHKTHNYFIAADCALRCFGLRPKMTFTKRFFPLVFSPKQPSNRYHHNRRRNIIITRV